MEEKSDEIENETSSDEIENALSPFLKASLEGRGDILQRLFEEGTNINTVNPKTGSSSLILSSNKGHFDIVKFLVSSKCDINHCNNDGETAIFEAAKHGFDEIVDFLIEHGAEVDLKNNKGLTALFVSSYKGHLKCATSLILAGADVDVTISNGYTPLCFSIHAGNYEMTSLLCEYGADVNVSDKYSPLDFAESNALLCRILLKYGAKKCNNASLLHIRYRVEQYEKVAKFMYESLYELLPTWPIELLILIIEFNFGFILKIK